jgi:hypothetical protein
LEGLAFEAFGSWVSRGAAQGSARRGTFETRCWSWAAVLSINFFFFCNWKALSRDGVDNSICIHLVDAYFGFSFLVFGFFGRPRGLACFVYILLSGSIDGSKANGQKRMLVGYI